MPRGTAYPYAVSRMPHNWAAGGVQFASAITAPTREELLQRIAEDVALRLFYAALDGETVPPPFPRSRAEDAVAAMRAAGADAELVCVPPARLSAHAAAIVRAMHEHGVSKADLARRMGVPRSVVSRLTNLLYFKHSADSLRRAADALDVDINLRLAPRGERRRHPRDAFDAVPLG